jgi:hypothetical protein
MEGKIEEVAPMAPVFRSAHRIVWHRALGSWYQAVNERSLLLAIFGTVAQCKPRSHLVYL